MEFRLSCTNPSGSHFLQNTYKRDTVSCQVLGFFCKHRVWFYIPHIPILSAHIKPWRSLILYSTHSYPICSYQAMDESDFIFHTFISYLLISSHGGVWFYIPHIHILSAHIKPWMSLLLYSTHSYPICSYQAMEESDFIFHTFLSYLLISSHGGVWFYIPHIPILSAHIKPWRSLILYSTHSYPICSYQAMEESDFIFHTFLSYLLISSHGGVWFYIPHIHILSAHIKPWMSLLLYSTHSYPICSYQAMEESDFIFHTFLSYLLISSHGGAWFYIPHIPILSAHIKPWRSLILYSTHSYPICSYQAMEESDFIFHTFLSYLLISSHGGAWFYIPHIPILSAHIKPWRSLILYSTHSYPICSYQAMEESDFIFHTFLSYLLISSHGGVWFYIPHIPILSAHIKPWRSLILYSTHSYPICSYQAMEESDFIFHTFLSYLLISSHGGVWFYIPHIPILSAHIKPWRSLILYSTHSYPICSYQAMDVSDFIFHTFLSYLLISSHGGVWFYIPHIPILSAHIKPWRSLILYSTHSYPICSYQAMEESDFIFHTFLSYLLISSHGGVWFYIPHIHILSAHNKPWMCLIIYSTHSYPICSYQAMDDIVLKWTMMLRG